jgi:ribosome recycling factor
MKRISKILNTQIKLSLKGFNLNLFSLSYYNFAKKTSQSQSENHKMVDDKREKSKKEKEELNQQYKDVSKEDLVSQYASKAKEYINKENDNLSKIMSLRVSTKLFEDVFVTLKHEKSKISEISTISMKGSNMINISPFDVEHKDIIIKALQTTKLDLQIKAEGNNILVIVGPIPKDLKLEITNKIKKIDTSFKDEIKKLKHGAIAEAKKLEKIIGKDESKRMEKSLVEVIDKESKKLEKDIKTKMDEVSSIK